MKKNTFTYFIFTIFFCLLLFDSSNISTSDESHIVPLNDLDEYTQKYT